MAGPGYADRDVTVRDMKLHYQEWGDSSAPVILMLHGFGVSGHMFDEFAERMQRQYRLIALDHRGHGDSDWSADGDYTRETFVADVEAFRQALGLERFVLIGHSMGGLIAVTYASRYPEHVESLVIVDVGPEQAREGVENIMRFTSGPDNLEFDEFVARAHAFNPRRTIENIQDRMRHRLKPGEDGKWTWKFDSRFRDRESGIQFGRDETNDDRWGTFRGVAAPTLLVRGGESDVLTPDTAERTVREMQWARLALVPHAGHSVPGDNPDAFTAAVQEFLDDVAGGRFPRPQAAAPSLGDLVDVQAEAASGRRKAGTLVFALAAAGVLVAIAAAVLAGRQRGKSSKKQAKQVGPVHLPEGVDLELARRRAAELVDELGAVGQRGVKRARRRLKDVDLDRARANAESLAAALGTGARHAPSVARTAAKKARRQAKRRKVRRAWVLPVLLGMAGQAQRAGKSRWGR